MAQRNTKFEQHASGMNFGQNRFRRQNTWDASCGEPKIKGRVISIPYQVWWYGAGAAHPNSGYHTFSFTLDPVTEIHGIEEIFEDKDSAFSIIRDESRRQLMSRKFNDSEASESLKILLEESWVNSGTENWTDFENFVFSDEAIDFLFAPYHVGAYATGPQYAAILYSLLSMYLRGHIACALDVEYLHWKLPFEQTAAEKQ